MGAGTYHWQKTEASPPPGLMSWSEHTMTGLFVVGDAQKLKQQALCTPHLKAALVPGQTHCRHC
jgi:hypothetical protein